MAVNSTSFSGLTNVTDRQDNENIASVSTVGLTVGLLLVILVALVPLVVYIIRRKMKHISHSERLPKTEGASQQVPDPHYIAAPAMVAPCTAQSPIYENVQRGFHGVSPKRQYNPVAYVTPSGHDDDPYMNCDPADEAVYSNDPSFRCEYEIEDDYVVPDTL